DRLELGGERVDSAADRLDVILGGAELLDDLRDATKGRRKIAQKRPRLLRFGGEPLDLALERLDRGGDNADPLVDHGGSRALLVAALGAGFDDLPAEPIELAADPTAGLELLEPVDGLMAGEFAQHL